MRWVSMPMAAPRDRSQWWRPLGPSVAGGRDLWTGRSRRRASGGRHFQRHCHVVGAGGGLQKRLVRKDQKGEPPRDLERRQHRRRTGPKLRPGDQRGQRLRQDSRRVPREVTTASSIEPSRTLTPRRAFKNAAAQVANQAGKTARVRFVRRRDYYPFRLREASPVVPLYPGRRAPAPGWEPELL